MFWMPVPGPVVLFWKTAEPLKGGAYLAEVGHQV